MGEVVDIRPFEFEELAEFVYGQIFLVHDESLCTFSKNGMLRSPEPIQREAVLNWRRGRKGRSKCVLNTIELAETHVAAFSILLTCPECADSEYGEKDGGE